MQSWLAAIHGGYYAVTGMWALIHMRSFLAVTGPKNDLWLVRSVAVMLIAVACPMALAAWRGVVVPEVYVLAIATSLGLALIDVYYVARGTIWKIYLADAALEIGFITAWLFIGPST